MADLAEYGVPLTGAAAARLYDDHVDAVHAMVTRRLGTELGARVTAEVFEQAVRSWDRFDGERNTERLFLLGIATVVLRRHRAAERAHLLGLRPPDRSGRIVHDPLVAIVDRDRVRDGDPVGRGPNDAGPPDEVTLTMRAVVDLDPDERDILLLSLWEGCQHSAVAEALDLAVGTVRSDLGRIRRELKKSVAAARPSPSGDTGAVPAATRGATIDDAGDDRGGDGPDAIDATDAAPLDDAEEATR